MTDRTIYLIVDTIGLFALAYVVMVLAVTLI